VEVAAVSIRPFNLPYDFRLLEQLTPQAYHYPKETGWLTRGVQEQEVKNFVDLLRTAKALWPLIALGQILSPRLRNALKGFIWEEDGKPVGLVASGEGANHTWWIANLAVLPAYRRRGIASRLAHAVIEIAKSLGGETMTLDVIAENLPAYQLYQRLGFETYNSSIEFLAPINPLCTMPTPLEYRIRYLKADEWQPHFQLAQRVTPADVQKFRPITIERFRSPMIERWMNRIVETATGISRGGMAIYWRGNPEPCASAQFTARVHPGGFHELNVRFDPAHPGLAVYILNAGVALLQNAHPNHPIHIHLYCWQEPLVLAAQELGCSKYHTYHTMGMTLI
jgi:ribosomal protein S18 acetylase RimI-like enzyme